MLRVLKATIFEPGSGCLDDGFSVDRHRCIPAMPGGVVLDSVILDAGILDDGVPNGAGRTVTFDRDLRRREVSAVCTEFAVCTEYVDTCAASVRAGEASGRQAMQAGP
jgi:hypothetical protein